MLSLFPPFQINKLLSCPSEELQELVVASRNLQEGRDAIHVASDWLLTPVAICFSPIKMISNATVNRIDEIEQLIALPLWSCCRADLVLLSCFANVEIAKVVVHQVPMQSLCCVLTKSSTITSFLLCESVAYREVQTLN